MLLPLCYVKYHVAFDTSTSVGVIDRYSHGGELVIDGQSGNFLTGDLAELYCENVNFEQKISAKNLEELKQYEFTENDLEDQIIQKITDKHTHAVSYVGRNNVSYLKDCSPLRRDIEIQNFKSLYAPTWTINAKIGDFSYKQNFFVNGKDKAVSSDELLICKLCDKHFSNHSFMFLCYECGRITCSKHKKIDYWDEKTPVCEKHYKKLKIFLQEKIFAKNETKKDYKQWLDSQNILVKLYEDKYVFSMICTTLFLLLLLALRYF